MALPVLVHPIRADELQDLIRSLTGAVRPSATVINVSGDTWTDARLDRVEGNKLVFWTGTLGGRDEDTLRQRRWSIGRLAEVRING